MLRLGSDVPDGRLLTVDDSLPDWIMTSPGPGPGFSIPVCPNGSEIEMPPGPGMEGRWNPGRLNPPGSVMSGKSKPSPPLSLLLSSVCVGSGEDWDSDCDEVVVLDDEEEVEDELDDEEHPNVPSGGSTLSAASPGSGAVWRLDACVGEGELAVVSDVGVGVKFVVGVGIEVVGGVAEGQLLPVSSLATNRYDLPVLSSL